MLSRDDDVALSGGELGHDRSETRPAAPTGLLATTVDEQQIDLSWVDQSDNETGFRIERAPSAGGPFAEIDLAGHRIPAGSIENDLLVTPKPPLRMARKPRSGHGQRNAGGRREGGAGRRESGNAGGGRKRTRSRRRREATTG